jgi:hypothetical protein
VPSLDLGSQPETRSTTAEIENGAWHVRIPVQVLAHSVPVSQTEDLSNPVRVDQIVNEDAASHEISLHPAADAACACELSIRPVM